MWGGGGGAEISEDEEGGRRENFCRHCFNMCGRGEKMQVKKRKSKNEKVREP